MNDSFFSTLESYLSPEPRVRMEDLAESDVERALEKAANDASLDAGDYLALLSPRGAGRLEAMARLAREATLRNFGRAIQLFTPLYLANYCTNQCLYCGFNTKNAIRRSMLTLEDIRREGEAIAATGLRHILLLTGDAPKKTGVPYIAAAARELRAFFPGIGIEVFSLTAEEYRHLREAGVDSMTMFQETYNPRLYAHLHPAGPKKDFHFRLEAPGRAAVAGMRTVNIGALLGLDDWRDDAFFTGMHARWLLEHFPGTEVAVSLPRMRPHVGVFKEVRPVTDRDLVQILTATRLFLPTCGITLSTRERPALRDHLIGLGVTKVSAGVSTAVGGHAPDTEEDTPVGEGSPGKDTGQFKIADTRGVEEMAAAIRARGCQPVFKHWQPLDGEDFRLERRSS